MMYLGLSVGQCVRDIVQQKMPYDDVFVIIGRTSFTKETIDKLIDRYIENRTWNPNDRTEYQHWLNHLLSSGQIIQPRRENFLVWPPHNEKLDEIFAKKCNFKWWMPLVTNISSLSPAAKEAWDNFVLIDQLGK